MKCKKCNHHPVPSAGITCNYCLCQASHEQKYGSPSDCRGCDHCNPKGGEFCKCGTNPPRRESEEK